MPALTDTFTLANGLEVPKIGFGTWQIPDGTDAYDAVATALKAGYRHIDTARAYGNEASVGRAVRDSGIPRDQIFVTTKLPAEIKDYDGAVASFETTDRTLDIGPADLYLIHAPWPWEEVGKDCRAGNIAVWRAMEELYAAGRVRSIGVSNFTGADIDSLMSESTVTPLANQIRYFIGHTQDDVTAYCTEHQILVEGYSPLATGAILDNAEVGEIAAKYSVSVAQLCIRYLLEHDVLPLPKSTTPSRIVDNAAVDFAISAEDLSYLDGLQDTAPD
jgi:diketogulonate reductase-like aldo/keto reductase